MDHPACVRADMSHRLRAVARGLAADAPAMAAAETTVESDVAAAEPARLRSKQTYFEFGRGTFLPEEEARRVVELAQRHGVWHMHSEGEVLSIGYGAGEGLPSVAGQDVPSGDEWFPAQPGPKGRVLSEDGKNWIFPHRFDMNVCLASVRENGRLYGRAPDPKGTSRSNFFRETFVYRTTGEKEYYGNAPELAKQVEDSLTAVFAPKARELYGRPIIEPNVVYCNMLRPGEEIGMHSDVPEFRGINRTSSPSWLVVLCHMSNLFEDHRVYSATGVSYYQDVKQGRMASYHHPDPQMPGVVHPAAFNSAVLLDTDSTYHHTDRVSHQDFPAQPEKAPGTVMRYIAAEDAWAVESAQGERLATHKFDDMRMSVSWKAHCFADEEEQRKYKDHSDDLTQERVFEVLVGDMRSRGLLEPPPAALPERGELIRLMLAAYVTEFPRAGAVAATWAGIEDSSFSESGGDLDPLER